MTKVFLSHVNEDKSVAKELSLSIRGAGFDVFFDPSDLPAGGDYHARIRNAIRESEYFVFLESKKGSHLGI